MADTTTNEDHWAPHVNLIAELYVEKHWSYEQIAKRLKPLGLDVSEFTVKARLKKWGISRHSYEDQLKIMAGHLLHQQNQGAQGSFLRWGRPFPDSEIEDFIQRFPRTQPSNQPLPAYLMFQPTSQRDVDRTELTQTRAQAIEIVDTDVSTAQVPTKVQPGSSHWPRKRPRNDVSNSRTQPSHSTPLQRSKRGREAAIEVSNRSGESDRDEAVTHESQSTEPKHQKFESAVMNLSRLMREMGYSYEEIVKVVSDPDDLRNITDKRNKKDERGRKDEEENHKNEKGEKKEATDLGPLHWAVYKNDARTLERLLKAGASINARGGPGATALQVAASTDSLEALKVLALWPGVDIDAVDNDGESALSRAILSSSVRCALLLVETGALVDIACSLGQTPLHWACVKENMQKLLEELLIKTKDVNHQDKNGHTPIHHAIGSRNWDYVMPLVKSGADLNTQDNRGRTAMHQACFAAPAELLMKLFQEDVNFTISGNDGETILHLLCQRNLCQVTKVALKKLGVNINIRAKNGVTPLLLALKSGKYDTARMLIQEGADVNIMDDNMHTALTVAIESGRDDIIDLLIERGSLLDPQNLSQKVYKARLEQDRKVGEVHSTLANARKSPAATTKTSSMRGSKYQADDAHINVSGNQSLNGSMKPGYFMASPMTEMVNVAFAPGVSQPNFIENFFGGSSAQESPSDFPFGTFGGTQPAIFSYIENAGLNPELPGYHNSQS